MGMTTLQWPDYVILALFLGISLGIGFYHSVTGGRQRTIQEFVMADRKLSVIPTAMSLFVSFQSAILILGASAEMYMFGIQYLVWGLISFAVAMAIVFKLIVPWIYPMKLVSINDYLELRFESKIVRVFGACCGIFVGIMYMGVAMYAPSAALESATGLPTTVSIPLMAIVSISYTALGGMKAVIWTDVFQFVTLMGGLFAILIRGLIQVGSPKTVADVCYREGRFITSNWSFDFTERHTVWGFMFGNMINWLMVYGFAQAAVQRFSATKSLAAAKLTILLNIPAVIFLYLIICSIGLTVYAYYSIIQCDPVVNEDISNLNQLLPLFVTTIFADTKGFAGLFLATLYGGALSSVSSSLSGSAANCWDDILKWKLHGLLEQRKTILNKVLVVIFGTAATGVAFLAAIVPGPIIQVTVTLCSAVGGPVYGIYFLGGLSRYANWKGALVGGCSSMLINIWLNVGALNMKRELPGLPPASTDGCWALMNNNVTTFNSSTLLMTTSTMETSYYNASSVSTTQAGQEMVGIQKFYGISYLWYSLFGVITTYIIGIIVSLMLRDREAEARVPDRLLVPFHKLLQWSDNEKAVEDEHSCKNNNNEKNEAAEMKDGAMEMTITNRDLEESNGNANDSLLNHRT